MKEKDYEIQEELAQEQREEPMREYINDNERGLEELFINSFPPEDQPLDDAIPDFLGRFADEFEEFCIDRFSEVEE